MKNKKIKTIMNLPLSEKISIYNKTIDEFVKKQDFLPEKATKIYYMKNIEKLESLMGGFINLYDNIIHDDFDTSDEYILVEEPSFLVTSGGEDYVEYIIRKGINHMVYYCEKEMPEIFD